MRVLIVEDHVKMAGLIKRGLEKEGMATDVAANGEDALWRPGACLLYTSPSPRDLSTSRMPSSA